MNLLSIMLNTRPLALPTALQVEPSNWCNLHCNMCPYNNLTEDKRAIDYSLFERIVKEIKPAYLLLTGATESFLHKDIFKMIDFAAKYATVKIDTNATLLTESFVDKIVNSRLDILSISLDSVDKGRYENIREGARLESVIEGIELLDKRRRAAGSRMHVHINAVLQKSNINDLSAILQFAGKVHVEHVGVAVMGGYGIEDSGFKDLLLTKEDIPAIVKSLAEAKQVARELGIHFDCSQLETLVEYDADYERLAMSLPCYMPFYYAYINSEGSVFPCCYSQDKQLVFGNVKEQPFRKIWYSREYSDFRNRLRSGKFGYCRSCIVGDMDIFETLERVPFVKLPRSQV